VDCGGICGDGICGSNEDMFSCFWDCTTCGNFACDWLDPVFCPEECGVRPF
jgi:hypothetical protein